MFRNIGKHTKENIITIGLAITLIFGIFLRFKGLTFQSYWLDELMSASFSNPANSFSYMFNQTISDVHPPLYQTILWSWYHIFGFNEFAGRALSAIIGSIGVFAVFLSGKEFFNKEVGLYAAIIAATNFFLIYYSQEVRSYSLLFLFSTISYVYLLKTIRDYSKKNFILYLLFTVSLVYTHYFGFFLVATQVFVFIFYFIKEKRNRKQLALLALITAIVLIVSLLPLIEHILANEAKKSFWIGRPRGDFILQYMGYYVQNAYLQGVFLLTILFSLIYLFQKSQNKNYKTIIVVLLLWILIGYMLPYIRSIISTPLLTPRNTIMVIPALILLISYGIYLLKDTALKIITIGTIVFLSIYQLNYTDYYDNVDKQQWREVLFEVSKSKKPIPSYDFIGYYPVYRTMLNLDMNIENEAVLKKKFHNDTLEQCFFAIDSHANLTRKSKVLQNKAITKVMEINRHSARGVLYAYNTTPQKCCKLYNGVLANPDFNECGLSDALRKEKEHRTDLKLQINDDHVLFHVDKYIETSSLIRIRGWAYKKGDTIDKSKKYIVFKGSKELIVYSTTNQIRPDITKHFQAKDLDQCGFNATIIKGELPKDSYDIYILVHDEDGSQHMIDTHKKVSTL